MRAKSPDVVIYVRSLYNGGIDRVMLNLIEQFLLKGLSITLLVDVDNPMSPFRAGLAAELEYVSLEAQGVFMRVLRLCQYLSAAKPRSMVSAGYFPNLFAILAKLITRSPVRLVVTEHNSPTINRQQSKLWEARRWFLPLARLLYPRADAIVAVSKGVAVDLAEQIALPRERVDYIYNPAVNDAMFEAAKAPVDHPWFNDPGVPVIMALGRLEPQKEFATLLHAFAQLRAHRPCRLVIFGEGSERAMLQGLIRTLGLSDAAELHGFVRNPHAFTAKASLMVLSSNWEGLSIVLIEALALGTPVVSTDCHFGPSEVLCDGQYGTLVPVGDVSRLAEAMSAALDHGTPKAPEEWLRQFRADTSAANYLQLLLGESPKLAPAGSRIFSNS